MKILLNEIRKKRGLSLRQVEYLTGVPKSTIADIEIKGDMTLDIAEQIARGLHVRICDLFISDYK